MQICGRRFSQPELDWIRHQVESRPDVNRVQLSRMFCSHVGWIKPDGGLKEMSCRVAMLRLERSGLIRLPEPKKKQGVVKGIARTLLAEPKADIHLQAGEAVLSLEAVDRQSAPLFNELIDRYHYLGYRRTGGAQIGFYSSLRLRTLSPQKITEKRTVSGQEVKRVVGVKVQVEVYKSSIWKPYRTAPVTIIFDYGIDDIQDCLQFIKDHSRENVYHLDGQALAKSMKEAISIVEKEKLEESLRKQVILKWNEIESQFDSQRKPKTR